VVNHSLQRHAEDRYESAQALGSALAEAATETWGDSWARDSGITLREIPFDVAPLGALQTASAPPVTAPPARTPPAPRLSPSEPKDVAKSGRGIEVAATIAFIVLVIVIAVVLSRGS
jgi:hypothetical protein